MPKKIKQQYKTLKGFKDVLPDQQKYWDFLYDRTRQTSIDYGFRKLDLPVLEDARIYIKGTGKTTDIVEKELYAFEDKGGNKVALRPEFTPGVLRAYLEHGMINQPQPVKLFSWGPIFRHDNPQAGRLRQFHQFNFEVIGSDLPETDSQFIVMIAGLYKSFGLDVLIEINTIGCSECRHEYVKELNKFLRKNKDKLCNICQERMQRNPLRILDCKEESCVEATQDVPQIVDYVCVECKDHFVKVLENLDEIDVIYSLNPRLVRGLDYYTRTTFEVFLNEENYPKLDKTTNEHFCEKNNKAKLKMSDKNQNEDKKIALGGGGRYDNLMEILGGRPTPAIGMAGGVERVISVLKQISIEVPDSSQADVFIAQLGDDAKKKSIKMFEDMRRENIRIREAFSKTGLKSQLEIANRLNVKYTLILGQKEMIDGTIIIRDMESGIQEIVPFEKAIVEIKKRLAGGNGVKVYTGTKICGDIKNNEEHGQEGLKKATNGGDARTVLDFTKEPQAQDDLFSDLEADPLDEDMDID
ncbi:MAG: histidine--tRNA ligase [Patescibacteria group bacterium]